MTDQTMTQEMAWAHASRMDAFWTYRAPKGACDWCPRCGFASSCADCRSFGF